MEKVVNCRLAVAPMLDWTDRHCRFFLRLISPHALLYTEMVTTGALLHGDYHRYLTFHPAEHPVALQLGGSDPQALARCAQRGVEYGYDEINLNVGCPSPRVQTGRFGACLMAEPTLVREAVAAMQAVVKVPVTVKTRIGIDDQDSYEHLCHFIDTVHQGGCHRFIIHARKAWLSGLSPKENRDIPPLRYDIVYRLKQDFPTVSWVLNGGLNTEEKVSQALDEVDGVMIGREAYHNPWFLAQLEKLIDPDAPPLRTRFEVLTDYIPYMEQELTQGTRLGVLTRPLLGLFQGLPGARSWRRIISEQAHRTGAALEVIHQAVQSIDSRGRLT